MVRRALVSGTLAKHMALHNEPHSTPPEMLRHMRPQLGISSAVTIEKGLHHAFSVEQICFRLNFLSSQNTGHTYINAHTQPQTHTLSSPALPRVYL